MFKIVIADHRSCSMQLARINLGWIKVRDQYIEMAEFWCSVKDRLELHDTDLCFDKTALAFNGKALGKPFRIRMEPSTISGSVFGKCFIEAGYPEEAKPLGSFMLDRNGHIYDDEGERIIDTDTFEAPHWVLLCNVLLTVID